MEWSDYKDRTEINELIGKVLTKVEENDDAELDFYTTDGKHYRMGHIQDCCESVNLEEVIGDYNDLVGHPILTAEERTQEGQSDWGSQTWTFYELATIKGSVTLRWLGESNGYYSESVDFVVVGENK